MPQALARTAVTALLALAAAWGNAQSGDWGDVAIVSSTLGNHARRVCVGAPDNMRPADFGCPTHSMYVTTGGLVGINTTNPTTQLEVNGTISATSFVGDGSNLTGISTQGDRIVSGTAPFTQMIAISDTRYISITQEGSNTGWFDPTRGLVTLGVSATGGISGTTGYFSGNVGIGTTPKGYRLTLAGETSQYPIGLFISATDHATSRRAGLGLDDWRIVQDSAGSGVRDFSIYQMSAGLHRLTIASSGNVGVGTLNPAAALQVSGSFIVSTSAQTTTPSLYVGSNGLVGIGTSSPGYDLDVRTKPGVSGHIAVRSDRYSGLYFVADVDGSSGGPFTYLSTVNEGSGVLEYRPGVGGANSGLMLFQNGSVGISRTNALAKLDVNGTISASSAIQIGTASGLTCSSGISGSIRYSSVSSTMEYCNSTAWVSMGPSATTVPAFSAFRTANQTVSANTWVKVQLSSENFDTQNNFDNATNYRFQPLVAGKYILTGQVECGSATGFCSAAIFKNGSLYLQGASYSTSSGAGAPVVAVVDMNGTTDYVELYAFTAATTLSGGSSSLQFSGSLIASGNGLLGGGGGTANPAGTTADVQFNNGGNLAADTGNFTYASGLLKAPIISVTTQVQAPSVSLTTAGTTWGYLANAASYLPTFRSTNISASSAIQVGSNSLTCSNGISGTIRYSQVSSTMEYCNSTAWVSMGPSDTVPISFFAHKNGTNQTVVADTGTLLTFSTELFDTNNNFASNRFTPTVRGNYLVGGAAHCFNNTSYCALYVYKNGAVVSAQQVNAGGDNNVVQATTLLSMNGTTDYAELYVYNGGGNIIGGQAATSNFWGTLIGSQSGSGGGGSDNLGNHTATQNLAMGAYNVVGTGQVSVTNVSATQVTAKNISATAIQVGNNGVACSAGISGSIRYSSISSTMEYCQGTAWVSMGPSATTTPAFHVQRSANLTVTTNTQTLIPFDVKVFDTQNNYNMSTHRFTPTVPGRYVISGGVLCSSSNNCQMAIRKNGNVVQRSMDFEGGPVTTRSAQLTVIVEMNGTSDYVEAWGFSGGTEIVGTNIETFFAGSLLGGGGGSGGGGTANPAGSTADVQFNNSGALAADTGNFTYASGLLKAPIISATTQVQAPSVSLTTAGTTWGYLSNASSYLPTLRTSTISASTAIQVGSNTLTCNSGISGTIRYSTTSSTLEYCNSVAWIGVANSTDASLTAFTVTKASQQSLPTAGTVVTWEDVVTNNGGAFNLSTERFVAPANGYYFFIASLLTDSDPSYGDFSIFKNAINTGLRSYGTSGAAAFKPMTAQGVLYLAAGDYVDVRSNLDSQTLTGGPGNSVNTFSGFLLNAGNGSGGGSDNLGNHTATQNLAMGAYNVVGTGQVSVTNISGSLIQVGTGNGATCDSSRRGAIRYSQVSSTMEYCNSTAWVSMGPSATTVPAFSVNRNNVAQTVSAGATTKILFTTIRYDTQNNFDTTNSRFRPTVAGYYYITASLMCGTSNSRCDVVIDRNGTPTYRSIVNGSQTYNMPLAAGVIYLNGSTDYVEASGYIAGDTSFNGSTIDTYFTGTLIASGNGLAGGGGGTATPAGSTADVQFNNSGALAADTGNFTYAAGLLKAPIISATTQVQAPSVSLTTAGTTWGYLSNASSYLPTLRTSTISASAAIQVGSNSLTCSSGISGSIRYSQVSSTMEYCNSTAWVSMGPSATTVPAFSVHKNGIDQTVTAGTWNPLTWSTEVYDTNNNFASNRFTPTIRGKYLVTLSLQCNAQALCAASIYKNGTLYLQNNESGNSGSAIVTAIVDMNGTNDYLEASGFNSGPSGGAATIVGLTETTRFEGILISMAGGGSGGGGADNLGDHTATQNLAMGVYNVVGTGQVSVTNVSATQVSTKNISATAIQLGNNGAACSAGISGSIRYSSVSSTMEYCNSTAWVSMGPSDTAVPAFSVTKDSVQSLATLGTVVTWESAITNYGGSFNLATERFVAPVSGYYFFIASLLTSNDAPTGDFHIHKNGASTGLRAFGTSGGTGFKPAVAQGILYLAAGDYVDVRSSSNSQSLYGSPGTSVSTFSGFLLNAGNASGGGSDNLGNHTATQNLAMGAFNVVGTGQVSVTNISGSLIQVGTGNGATCDSSRRGALRYSQVSSTMEYCNSTAWVSMGPSDTQVISFAATKGGTQTVASNVATRVSFNNETFDTNNNFTVCTTNCNSGAQSSSESRFTPTVRGKYLLTAGAYCNGGNGYCQIDIYKNGVSQGVSWVPAISGNGDSAPAVTAIVDMNGASDYAEVYVTSNGTSILTARFQGAILGPQAGGSGGSANPAGNTADVQFNNGGNLAADTGVFTYASGLLKVPTISATTQVQAPSVSLTTAGTTWGYLGSGGSYLPTLMAARVSSTNISVTTVGMNGDVFGSIGGPGGNFIASGSTSISITSSNVITIATGGSQRLLMNSSGYVRVGPGLATGARLSAIASIAGDTGITGFSQDGSAYGYLGYNNAWGVVCTGANCGGNQAWTNYSDARLKERIRGLSQEDGLAAIMKLKPVRFHWRDAVTDDKKGEQLGFIAQDIAKIFPEVIGDKISSTITTRDGHSIVVPDTLNLSYATLVVPMTKAIQELKAENDNLKSMFRAASDNDQLLRMEFDELRRELRELKQANKK